MANPSQQTPPPSSEQEDKNSTLADLPLESSPYVKYSDLEDYKRQGYGTEGHLQVNPNQTGGGTDAPTLSGSDVSDDPVKATEK